MSALDEEAVDWGDVEGAAMEAAGDDVISLGGAEDLEEEVVITVPAAEAAIPETELKSNGKIKTEGPKAGSSSIAAPVEKSSQTKERPLPAGWRLQEARSGGTYYFNTVTGKATWDFPTEEAVASKEVKTAEVNQDSSTELKNEKVKGKVEETAKPMATEKLGIQIKGAARGNNSTFRKDDISPAPETKKREAETQPAKESADSKPIESQKRRRSNTPPETQVQSTLPEKAQVAPVIEPVKSNTVNGTDREEAVKGGWGRRADIADQAKVPSGPNADRNRSYNQDRFAPAPRSREEISYQQRREEPQRRDFIPDNRAVQRSEGREGPRNHYEDRRTSPQNERSRDPRREPREGPRDDSHDRRREPSPVPKRQNEYDQANGRDIAKSDREALQSGEPVGASRERDRTDLTRSYSSGNQTDQSRMYPERGTPANRDRGSDRESSRPHDDRRQEANPNSTYSREKSYSRDDNYSEQRSYSKNKYGGSRDSYVDRSNGVGRPAHPTGYKSYPGAHNQGFQAPQSEYGSHRGYQPRNQYTNAAIAPLNSAPPFPPANGPQRGPLSAGARPVRPWISPEEKQKRWWNKNTGERKPVSLDGSSESDAPTRSRESIPQDQQPPSSANRGPSRDSNRESGRASDRERELAEREAAIARKERELGLR